MNLSMVLGMFVCSSFLVSECTFTVSKALLMSRATVIVHAGGVLIKPPGYCVVCMVECCACGVFLLEAVHPVEGG